MAGPTCRVALHACHVIENIQKEKKKIEQTENDSSHTMFSNHSSKRYRLIVNGKTRSSCGQNVPKMYYPSSFLPFSSFFIYIYIYI